MSRKEAQVLRKAADHIERVGLHKGTLYEDDQNRDSSPCCIIGALDWVEHDWMPTLSLLEHHLGTVAPRWNDEDDQTTESVVRRLREVAAQVEVEVLS